MTQALNPYSAPESGTVEKWSYDLLRTVLFGYLGLVVMGVVGFVALYLFYALALGPLTAARAYQSVRPGMTGEEVVQTVLRTYNLAVFRGQVCSPDGREESFYAYSSWASRSTASSQESSVLTSPRTRTPSVGGRPINVSVER